MTDPIRTECLDCRNDGYVFCRRKGDDAPYSYVFRCLCAHGRAKHQTGIPMFLTRCRQEYEVYDPLSSAMQSVPLPAQIAALKASLAAQTVALYQDLERPLADAPADPLPDAPDHAPPLPAETPLPREDFFSGVLAT